MPVVSVILPVFNSQPYLAAAVSSILGQTFRDFEMIAIDDGSTDRSLEILREFERRDERIRVISRPNTGIVGALNDAIDAASGLYLARMDADDIAMPERFAMQVEFLERHASVVAVGTHWELFDDDGRLIHIQRVPSDDASMQFAAMRGATPFCHPAVMLRATAMREVGGYDPTTELAEDLDLALRLGEVGELANIDRVLMRIRLSDRSLSGSRASEQQEMQREVVLRAAERRGCAFEFAEDMAWRPSTDRSSRFKFHLKYGWWAFRLGKHETARVYARRAIATMPWRLGGWKLWRSVMFKRSQDTDQ